MPASHCASVIWKTSTARDRARDVEECIDPAEAVEGRLHDRFSSSGGHKVHRQHERLGSDALDLFSHLGELIAFACSEHERAEVLREPKRRGFSDPRAGPGNDRDRF